MDPTSKKSRALSDILEKWPITKFEKSRKKNRKKTKKNENSKKFKEEFSEERGDLLWIGVGENSDRLGLNSGLSSEHG